MEKNLEQAIKNIGIVVRQARMTAEEHEQLAADVRLIKEKLYKPDFPLLGAEKKSETTE